MTLRDYILRWQDVYDKNQSRPTTYAAHGYIFKNHILPGLGEIPLSELTMEQVGDFLEERRRFGGHRPESPEYPGLGEHTMRHIHRLLQQCLDQAIRDGLIADNPARAFHYPKPKKVSANVLTPSEVWDYLDAAERLGHKEMMTMENKLLKELYDYFYVRPELDEQENEVGGVPQSVDSSFGKTGAQAGAADHRCPKLYHRADIPRQFYCRL